MQCIKDVFKQYKHNTADGFQSIKDVFRLSKHNKAEDIQCIKAFFFFFLLSLYISFLTPSQPKPVKFPG